MTSYLLIFNQRTERIWRDVDTIGGLYSISVKRKQLLKLPVSFYCVTEQNVISGDRIHSGNFFDFLFAFTVHVSQTRAFLKGLLLCDFLFAITASFNRTYFKGTGYIISPLPQREITFVTSLFHTTNNYTRRLQNRGISYKERLYSLWEQSLSF